MTIRHLDALLSPKGLLVVGEATDAASEEVIANFRRSKGLPLWQGTAELNSVPEGLSRQLAVIANPALASERLIVRLAQAGCRALLWQHADAPALPILQETRRQQMRVLGPRSGGVSNPRLPLSATSFPAAPAVGDLALIAQSQSIAAAALDWAAGRHLGFSWVAISGGEADVDVADLLDYAALDPNTRGVVLQLSSIRSGRKFMSAARACARLKPVVVLQSQPAARIGRGPDRVRSAAFARAGLVECENLPGLFDALSALQRLPALLQPQVLVVGNGAGICALGVDALARQGLSPFRLDEARRQSLPACRDAGGALDAGKLSARALADLVRDLLQDPGLPALLLIHSPGTGSEHLAVANRLAANPDPRLLTVWLGLETALPARTLCAQAGLATFTSADGAARALRYRWEYNRNRELLTQTPPRPATLSADPSKLRKGLQALVADGVRRLPAAETGGLLLAYGIAPAEVGAPARLKLCVIAHQELGLYLELSTDGVSPTCCFAPLDQLLAVRVLEQLGLVTGSDERDSLCAALIQLAQMLVDQADLSGLSLHLAGDGRWVPRSAELLLGAKPVLERQRLILAPYPSELCGGLIGRDGRRYRYRPVRPADEPALISLLQRLDPEEVRMRFFIYMRQFSHDMGARMTQIDYDREMSLVLVPEGCGEDEVMAIATLVADPDGHRAEFALLVHHDHAGGGLGRQLLQRLLEHAWQREIGTVYGSVLAENTAMLAAARRLGFSQRPEPDEPGCVRVEIGQPAPKA